MSNPHVAAGLAYSFVCLTMGHLMSGHAKSPLKAGGGMGNVDSLHSIERFQFN